jgi:hypothetical protein
MYLIYPCKKENENIFNIKIDLKLKENILKKFKFKYCGKIKDYYKNNYYISSTSTNISFFKIKETNSYFKNSFLFIEYIKEEQNPFNFYKVDYDEEYHLYESKKGNINILLKEFNRYLELEFITEDLKNIDFNLINI